MTGASKILTVSYGTFSCTLEGFDDPFNTMRAIAEYFRDLAADDRYFGAEPPTPDAAMLHRIAEREVQRRVDAKVQDNGIHLRATDVATPEGPVAVAPAVAPAMAPALAPVASAAADPAETIAERLLRIRSEVAAQSQPAPAATRSDTAPTVTLPLDGYVEDLPDPRAAAPAAPVAPAPAATPAPETAAPPATDIAPPLPQDAEPHDRPATADAAAAAIPAALADTLAAPLDQPATPALADPLDDLAADHWPDPLTTAPALADPLDDPAPAALADDLPGPAPAARPESGQFSDTLRAALAESDLPAAAPAPSRPPRQPDPLDLALADSDDDTASDTGFDGDDDLTEALTQGLDQPAPEDDPVSGLDTIFGEMGDLPPEPLAELRPDAAEKLQRARARVFRIRRSDGAAPEAGAATEAQPEPAAAPPLRTAPHPFVDDPSAEDAVSRLMAQADSEMEGEETKRRQSAIAHLKAAVAQTEAERRAGEAKPDVQPSRIARYRNDLAMVVRAAIPGAAARPPADRPAPLVLVSEQRIDRPSRPAPPTAPPAAAQTAALGGPIPASAAAAPLRPRRVTAAGQGGLAMQSTPAFAPEESELDEIDRSLAEALADDDDLAADPPESESEADLPLTDTRFRDYADSLGASSLRDMIEAAAAWLTCDQGRAHFTRPQLMRHVAIVIPPTDALREDGLRIFGTLLRDGHIAKVRRGLFTLTERSPYHTGAARHPG